MLCKKGSDGTRNEADIPKNSVRYTKDDGDNEEDADHPTEYQDDAGNYGEDDDWCEDDEYWEEEQEDTYEEEDEWYDYDNYEDDSYYEEPEERTFRVTETCPQADNIFMVTELPVLSEVHLPELTEIAEAFKISQNQSQLYFGVPDPEEIDELDDKQYIVDTDHPVIQEMADLVQSNFTGERTGLTKVIKLL